MNTPSVKALTFDVFGTVVDWRAGIAREGAAIGRAKGIERDWPAFADSWRALYQPAMEEVRSGRRAWTKLDDLHRESLVQVLKDYDVAGLTEDEVTDLSKAWHRLDPWPEAVRGLTRLKTRFILGTLSNGNVALMVNMAKRGGLPWDVILGSEVVRHYKPQPATYLLSAEMLGLRPDECMMVAAHAADLAAARSTGFHTAFITRPDEYGPTRKSDDPPKEADYIARDFEDLASQLGC